MRNKIGIKIQDSDEGIKDGKKLKRQKYKQIRDCGKEHYTVIYI